VDLTFDHQIFAAAQLPFNDDAFSDIHHFPLDMTWCVDVRRGRNRWTADRMGRRHLRRPDRLIAFPHCLISEPRNTWMRPVKGLRTAGESGFGQYTGIGANYSSKYLTFIGTSASGTQREFVPRASCLEERGTGNAAQGTRNAATIEGSACAFTLTTTRRRRRCRPSSRLSRAR